MALALAALVAAARAAAGTGCQAAGAGPGSAGEACGTEPDGAQPDDVQADALLQSGRRVESVAPLAGGDVDAANKSNWHICRLEGTCAYCTSSMYVPMVKPPWETMSEKVHNANSMSKCERCAGNFQAWGLLQPGWWCKHYLGWGYYIKRNEQSSLTAIKPVEPIDLAASARGLGPLTVGTAPLPESLRGIFWLMGQEDSSAAMTFGSNGGADCDWCSTGSLVGNRYRVRVCGEHTWAFAGRPTQTKACDVDLIYDFKFDDPSRPTWGQIHPVLGALGQTSLAPLEFLLNFEMELMSEGDAEFPNSTVWSRDTYSFGQRIDSATYRLVQIVDQDGAHIEPAWTEFVGYQGAQVDQATVYTRR